ncbi:hypothetical protein ACEPAF_1351 [Sanghuangporus sanghuang]
MVSILATFIDLLSGAPSFSGSAFIFMFRSQHRHREKATRVAAAAAASVQGQVEADRSSQNVGTNASENARKSIMNERAGEPRFADELTDLSFPFHPDRLRGLDNSLLIL